MTDPMEDALRETEAILATRHRMRVDIRVDDDRRLALISSPSGAIKFLLAAAGLAHQARWSSYGLDRGYVIGTDLLDRLRAYLDTQTVVYELKFGTVMDPAMPAVDEDLAIPVVGIPGRRDER